MWLNVNEERMWTMNYIYKDNIAQMTEKYIL